MWHPDVCNIILSLTLTISKINKISHPKGSKMPKATQKSVVAEEEEETALHGTVNLEEARRHALNLDNVLDELEESIKTSTAENKMKITIERFKSAIVEIAPYMEEAKVMSVLKSIKDTSCMALMPLASEREERLEAMMPESEAPDPKDILSKGKQLGDLTKEQKELMGELFDELKTAHESLTRASSTLGRLSRSLNSRQLLLTLQASVRPLIQLNTLDKFWKEPIMKTQKTELPDNIHQRVALTMIPDASSDIMKKENHNSPTRLLAATLAFKLLRRFGQGTTQRNMQELFNIRPKQLALCITGCKYLGGTNRRAKKQRASGEELSTSAQ